MKTDREDWKRQEGPWSIAPVREKKPLIHCITNYVTAGFVANMLLAAGASPVMADHMDEMEDLAAVCDGLVLNLGTLKEGQIPAMILAGKLAGTSGCPVVLDPVGAGSIRRRRAAALALLEEVSCTVIRGNASELWALAEALQKPGETDPEETGKKTAVKGRSGGVDLDAGDRLRKDNLEETILMLRELSCRTGAILVMTGAVDLVVDPVHTAVVKNGHPWMGRITGSGCMLDGILAAFLAVVPERSLEKECCKERFDAAVLAAAAAGICGELAGEKAEREGGGTGSFLQYFMDAMSCLEDEIIEKRHQIYLYEGQEAEKQFLETRL